MFVVGFAGMNCTPSNAGEWWEGRMRQVKKSTWLQGLDIEHQVYWPPMQEDGKAAWGRQDAHYHFHDVYLLMCVQVLAPRRGRSQQHAPHRWTRRGNVRFVSYSGWYHLNYRQWEGEITTTSSRRPFVRKTTGAWYEVILAKYELGFFITCVQR